MMIWKQTQGTYSSGETLWLGEIAVGVYSYNSGRPKGSPASYLISSNLPHIKPKITIYPTTEEAKNALEAHVLRWLNRAGLVPREP